MRCHKTGRVLLILSICIFGQTATAAPTKQCLVPKPKIETSVPISMDEVEFIQERVLNMHQQFNTDCTEILGLESHCELSECKGLLEGTAWNSMVLTSTIFLNGDSTSITLFKQTKFIKQPIKTTELTANNVSDLRAQLGANTTVTTGSVSSDGGGAVATPRALIASDNLTEDAADASSNATPASPQPSSTAVVSTPATPPLVPTPSNVTIGSEAKVKPTVELQKGSDSDGSKKGQKIGKKTRLSGGLAYASSGFGLHLNGFEGNVSSSGFFGAGVNFVFTGDFDTFSDGFDTDIERESVPLGAFNAAVGLGGIGWEKSVFDLNFRVTAYPIGFFVAASRGAPVLDETYFQDPRARAQRFDYEEYFYVGFIPTEISLRHSLEDGWFVDGGLTFPLFYGKEHDASGSGSPTRPLMLISSLRIGVNL